MSMESYLTVLTHFSFKWTFRSAEAQGLILEVGEGFLRLFERRVEIEKGSRRSLEVVDGQVMWWIRLGKVT